MAETPTSYNVSEYIGKRRKLHGIFFETALPNEYLVQIGTKKIRPTLGGRKFSLFRKFLRIPASIQTLEFATDNANIHFQGIGIEGFACWQINPADPVQAIRTLDLFDEDNPMARTNYELQLLCIEAIRHLIANMTIEDAHRKKEEIAADLRNQLKQIEQTWGIVFHQVGIRNVKVMSESVFNDLQAKYRNAIRLESSRTRIDTDKKIATEENARSEQSESEKLESAQKLAKQKLDNRSKQREDELRQEQVLSQKEYELEVHKKTLEIKIKNEQEKTLLAVSREIESLRNAIAALKLDMRRADRKVEQEFSEEALMNQLIVELPQIAAALKIQNYTVLSGDGGGISPVGKLIQEVLTILQGNKLSDFTGKQKPPKATDK